jgi:GGDEF domain-containing protein
LFRKRSRHPERSEARYLWVTVDELLVEVAERLRSAAGSEVLVGRIAGTS